MDEPHLFIGHHDEHGFVARPHHGLTPHLADWMLTRTMFEKVPSSPLYRLTDPHRHGRRRARQAVEDLRALGVTVQADVQLDPRLTPEAPRPAQTSGLAHRRAAHTQNTEVRPRQGRPVPAASRGGASASPPSAAASSPRPSSRL